MKEETKESLIDYVRDKNKLYYDDVDKVYNIYTTSEIGKLEDLHRDHSGFVEFLIKNIDKSQLDKSEGLDFFRELRSRMFSLREAGSRHFKIYRKTQENFAKEVELLVGGDVSKNIMEVGGGAIPYSSLIMARDGYKVTTIDKKFDLPKVCMSRMNVKSFRSEFNNKTKIQGYDVVVGRRPCSAIRSIVNNCSENKVPYFIRLCVCEAPFNVMKGWYDELPFIDRDIKFSGPYAYNLKHANFSLSKDIEEIIEIDDDEMMC